jgi:hypothetical protein
MNLLYEILTFIGFIAVTFGAAGTISRWLKESEERKRAVAQNHREITEALARIEESLRHTKP